MSESKDATHNVSELAPGQLDMTPEMALKTQAKVISASIDQARMMQTYWIGLSRYIMDFMAPAFSALESFRGVESDKLEEYSPEENIRDYVGLLELNLRLAEKGLTHGMKAINDFHAHQFEQAYKAWVNTLYHQKAKTLRRLWPNRPG